MTAEDGFQRALGLAGAASTATAIGRGEVSPVEPADAVPGGLEAANTGLNAGAA